MSSAFQAGLPGAPFEAVVFNQDLGARPSRAPDYGAENHALTNLITKLADAPETILDALVDELLAMFKVHSAGISLLTQVDGEERFLWPAIAGEWKPFIGGGTPRAFGPCGDVIDRRRTFLFRDLERRWAYYEAAKPRVEECLLAPFYVDGEPVGTLWIVSHDKVRKFDSEDLRQLESIGSFAATAYRARNALLDSQQKSEKLKAAETTLRQQVVVLEESAVQLAAANADLNHFAFAATHDLREPLRAVSICTQLLSNSLGEKLRLEEQQWMNSILEGSVRMDALIKDLVAYAQTDERLRKMDEKVDLNLVFDQAVFNLQTAIQESKAVVAHDELPTACVHPGRFIQLLQNLIGNSIKYRSPQPPAIYLAVREEGDEWHFILSDNGLGLDPKNHQSIFETFKRLHGREISGTGLGLAICRRIVTQQGGRIWVESSLGAGAKFHFTMPRRQTQDGGPEDDRFI